MESSSSISNWTPECLKLENQEFELTEELKHDTKEDLERDASILKQIGITYKMRGKLLKDASCFIKASALFNSALVRSKKSKTITELRTENESWFLDHIVGIKSTNLSTQFISKQKKQLLDFREGLCQRLETFWKQMNETYDINAEDDTRIAEEKKIIDQVCTTSSETSAFMKSVVRNIIHECFRILGKPPQKYAVLGLGSLARNEMTPYSDLESAILIEDDSCDKQYFRNLANLFHLLILNFGETPLPALAIKSLNDFDKVDGNWFYDYVTCNGFCMDGSMPWACKTPIGRPDREFKKGIELIQTPDNMSKFHDKNVEKKEGYHLADILCTCTLIDGSNDLVEQYEALLQNNEYVKDRSE